MERLMPNLRRVLCLHLAQTIAKEWSHQELMHFAVYTMEDQYRESESVFDDDFEWLNLPKRFGGLGADDEKDTNPNHFVDNPNQSG